MSVQDDMECIAKIKSVMQRQSQDMVSDVQILTQCKEDLLA